MTSPTKSDSPSGRHSPISPEEAHRRALTVGIAASAVLLLIGFACVEWIPIRPIVQLTLWRGTRFPALVLFAFGAAYLVDCLRSGGFAAVAAGLTLTAFATPDQPQLAFIGHLGLLGLLAQTLTRSSGARRWFGLAPPSGQRRAKLLEHAP